MPRPTPLALVLLLGLGCDFDLDVGTDRAPTVHFEVSDPDAPPPPTAPPLPAPTTAEAPTAPTVESPPPAPVTPTFEAPPTAPEVPDTPLEIRFDGGEPLPWRSAWAYSRGGRALFFVFSTRAVDGCPARSTRSSDEETTVHVSTFPVLPSDGVGWRAANATGFLAPFGLRTASPGAPAPARIEEAPSERGDPVRGGLDFVTPEISARGRFEGIYCGDEPRTPPPAAQDTVHVEVGGETVPIRGARFLLQDEMIRLELTSNGTSCRPVGGGSDVELEFVHHGPLPSPRQTSLYARGHRLVMAPALIIAGEQDDIHFRYDPAAVVPGSTVRAEVAFAGDLRGLPVLVRGFVDAEVCPRL